MMTENTEQKAASNKLRAAIEQRKREVTDYLLLMSRVTAADIRNTGYPDFPTMASQSIIRLRKEIERMIRAYEAKYPD